MILSDPDKRAEHDAWIARQEVPPHVGPAVPGNQPHESSSQHEHSSASTSPPNETPRANYADAARAFRQSRVAPESSRPEPRSAPASEPSSTNPIDGGSTKASPRKHRSFRLTESSERETNTISIWMGLGIPAGLIMLAAIKHSSLQSLWPGLSIWHVLVLLGLVVGLCMKLFGRRNHAPKQPQQQVTIDSHSMHAEPNSGAHAPPSKPMSAWTGLGIGAATVAAMMLTMSLNGSRTGRVVVVLGVGILAWLGLRFITRAMRKARDTAQSSEANGFAWWLTAMIWGWLAYVLTPHRLADFTAADHATFVIVLLAAWIPARRACLGLLSPNKQGGDLTWMRISGYMYPITLAVVFVAMLRGSHDTPLFLSLAQPTGVGSSPSGLILAHDAGTFLGAIISAALVTVMLVGIGALVSSALSRACIFLEVRHVHTRVSTLLASWAAIPVLSMVMFLANWVP